MIWRNLATAPVADGSLDGLPRMDPMELDLPPIGVPMMVDPDEDLPKEGVR